MLRVPRPVHEKRDPAQAEAFKRHFFGILKNVPLKGDKPVKVWFADESRYGLLPNLMRVWTKKGQRPHKRWKSEYKWSYCYGAIDPIAGQNSVPTNSDGESGLDAGLPLADQETVSGA